jgi:hypothetical protein
MGREYKYGKPDIMPEILGIARNAVSMDSPLAAELYIQKERAAKLDNIAPLDNFSSDSLFVYALRLKLAQRIRLFTEEAGLSSYRKIYDKILGEAK